MSINLLCKCIAESLGTCAIVFFGCGLVAVATTYELPILLFGVPIVFGLTVSCMIYALAHISGAHFNPAVTLAFAAVRRFPWREVPYYWVAQILGGIVGSLLISMFVPNTTTFAATVPVIPVWSAFGLECVLSFFLMFVIISVATDSRAIGTTAGIAIGTIITMDAFLGGPLTGASMNPARSIGPALFENTLEPLWLYILAPCLGAVLAAFLYEAIKCHPNNKTKEPISGCC